MQFVVGNEDLSPLAKIGPDLVYIRLKSSILREPSSISEFIPDFFHRTRTKDYPGPHLKWEVRQKATQLLKAKTNKKKKVILKAKGNSVSSYLLADFTHALAFEEQTKTKELHSYTV